MTFPTVRHLPVLSAFCLLSCAEKAPPLSSAAAEASRLAAMEERPAPVPAAAGRVTRMPLGDLFRLQQTGGALVYDVRPAFFYQLGHIPGAVNWPKNSYASRLAEREPEIRSANLANRPVVLYCTDLACPDARTVADRLASRGHRVSILEGGWDAWKTGDLPTE